jgi:hypothetical protein
MEDNINGSTENLVELNQSLNRRRKKLCVIGTLTILGVLLLAVILFFMITDPQPTDSQPTDPQPTDPLPKFLTNSKCATDIQ